MDTFEEQLTFFKEQWPAMKEAAESGGDPVSAAVEFVRQMSRATKGSPQVSE